MAKAKAKELTVEEKLSALQKLQEVHSKIDEIRQLRGELPMEVADLEDELAGYNTRVDKINTEIDDLEADITNRKLTKKEAEKLIEKYDKQLLKVKNNREFDALTKEMELQKLEIQLSDKRIKESQEAIEAKTAYKDETVNLVKQKEEELKDKKQELTKITTETEKEEEKLNRSAKKAQNQIEDRYKVAYDRLRKRYKNGLAVVEVSRGACGGCFAIIPPQRQLEIKSRKKIMVCEHCGRILASVAEAE